MTVTDIRAASRGDLAIMLTGGGARAAYQVGLLRGIARHFPELRFDIITGVSAGAINAAFLAAHPGPLGKVVDSLTELWCQLECEHVFRFDWKTLIPFRSALNSILPRRRWARPRGLVDTTPLGNLLCRILHSSRREPVRGIIENLHSGQLRAFALMTLDYSTGQAVRWVQGRTFSSYEGPNRRVAETQMTVEHVLASSAIPFVFPAVRIDDRWYGDGGVRLSAPLSPAVHLGASRIIAMSTGYQRTPDEASTPVVHGYPPAAQVLGQMVNAIFLDNIDEDVVRMQRMNEMIRKLDPRERDGFKPIDLMILRPSRDLAKLASGYEKYLPANLKLVTRALGSSETDSPDLISLMMFEPHYTRELIALGEADVDSRLGELRAFLSLSEPEPQAVAL